MDVDSGGNARIDDGNLSPSITSVSWWDPDLAISQADNAVPKLGLVVLTY